jgi:hypothetical protein
MPRRKDDAPKGKTQMTGGPKRKLAPQPQEKGLDNHQRTAVLLILRAGKGESRSTKNAAGSKWEVVLTPLQRELSKKRKSAGSDPEEESAKGKITFRTRPKY